MTTGKDQIISCSITGLDAGASIKWIDPDGNDIQSTDTTNYIVTDDGESGFTAGSTQTPKLTLKKVVVEKITSAKTYQCAVTSGKYAKSGWFKGNVVVTPISKYGSIPILFKVISASEYQQMTLIKCHHVLPSHDDL